MQTDIQKGVIMKKYYEILELEENCSTADVKVAFIRKLKAIPKITKEKMLPYAQAYVVLSHPSERKKYDDLPETEYDFSAKYPSVSNPEKICDVIQIKIKIIIERAISYIRI